MLDCVSRRNNDSSRIGDLPSFNRVGGSSDDPPSVRGGARKNGQNLALRRAWDAQYSSNEPVKRRTRNTLTKATGPAVDHLREWFRMTVSPRMATCPIAQIRRATGLSKHYAVMIRQGYVPHPRHYPMLAPLVDVEMPSLGGIGKGTRKAVSYRKASQKLHIATAAIGSSETMRPK